MAESTFLKMKINRGFSCSGVIGDDGKTYAIFVHRDDVIKVRRSYFNELPDTLGTEVAEKTPTNVQTPVQLVKKAMTLDKSLHKARQDRVLKANQKVVKESEKRSGKDPEPKKSGVKVGK